MKQNVPEARFCQAMEVDGLVVGGAFSRSLSPESACPQAKFVGKVDQCATAPRKYKSFRTGYFNPLTT